LRERRKKEEEQIKEICFGSDNKKGIVFI